MATEQFSGILQHLRKTALLQGRANASDRELLAAMVAGNEAAFGALVRRHAPMVWSVCRRLLSNLHDAEDAFQATFLVLIRKAATLRDGNLVSNWLWGTAQRAALEARAQARRRQRERQVKVMPEPPTRPAEDCSDLGRVLDHELGRLPEKYRVPVILCDLEGKTRREVARQLQVPEGTLSGRLTTAHRLLAKRLRRRGITLSGAALAAALAQQAAAAVPAHVISGTITVVASLAAGRTPACAVSAKVAMLASGVLRAMFIKKLSRVAVLVLIFCGFAVGAGASYWRTAAHVPGAESTAPITNNGVRRRVVDQRPTKAEKRKPRILLLAGAPGREYQFLHALFRREAQENLCEFAVYLQTADKKKGADQFDSFDVIIALDPNWAAIQKEKLDSLPKWVKEHGGGLVFVAGAVHTPQLAIPAFDADLSKTKAMCPVTLKDGRLHFDKMEHDASRPYALEFSKAARKFGFLKLDQGEDPLAGWNKFFWKDEKKPNGDAIPVRGFHTYYPVEKLRPTATVLASFVGPAASRIGDGKIPQPFIVYQRYGRGATLYIGASEMWRLRAFSETYYDHFWTQLAHFMTAVKQSGK